VTQDPRREGETGATSGELRLLALLREGHLPAFEGLYRLYQPRLSRFVIHLVRRAATVEEVVNDTMMVLWDKPGSFQGQSKLSTWLFAIAYRKAIRARLGEDEPVDERTAPELPDEDAVPDRDFARKRAAAMLRAAIDDLSPDHRAVVHLTYFQEASYREIADIMGCPPDTVKTRMFHARRHLKQKLEGELADWL